MGDYEIQKARPAQKLNPPLQAGFCFEDLLLIATLVASLTKQLAVLLLRHTLTALLDN